MRVVNDMRGLLIQLQRERLLQFIADTGIGRPDDSHGRVGLRAVRRQNYLRTLSMESGHCEQDENKKVNFHSNVHYDMSKGVGCCDHKRK